METLIYCGLLIVAAWLFVRYIKRLQDTTDRRYPESSDDGRLGGGGGYGGSY